MAANGFSWHGWKNVSVGRLRQKRCFLSFSVRKHWNGSSFKLESSNSIVVSALRSGNCSKPIIKHLLRTLHFVAAHFAFTFSTSHLLGSQNTLGDELSPTFTTDHVSAFPQLNPSPHSFLRYVDVELLCNTSVLVHIGHQTSGGLGFLPLLTAVSHRQRCARIVRTRPVFSIL